MEHDLTILHKSYKYSCYQSWSTCSWFHILDSHDIIPGSLTNIRDFMEMILTVHRFKFCRYFLPSSRQKKMVQSTQFMVFLFYPRLPGEHFVEQFPKYVGKMHPFVQPTVNWKIHQIYKRAWDIGAFEIKSCEICPFFFFTSRACS